MKKKKLSKRMDYPTVVFLQVNRVGKILVEENMEKWQPLQRYKQAVFGLEAIIRCKAPGDNIEKKDMDDLETINKRIKELGNKSQNMDKICEALNEKYVILNELIDKIGLAGLYPSDTPTYGEHE